MTIKVTLDKQFEITVKHKEYGSIPMKATILRSGMADRPLTVHIGTVGKFPFTVRGKKTDANWSGWVTPRATTRVDYFLVKNEDGMNLNNTPEARKIAAFLRRAVRDVVQESGVLSQVATAGLLSLSARQ